MDHLTDEEARSLLTAPTHDHSILALAQDRSEEDDEEMADAYYITLTGENRHQVLATQIRCWTSCASYASGHSMCLERADRLTGVGIQRT